VVVEYQVAESPLKFYAEEQLWKQASQTVEQIFQLEPFAVICYPIHNPAQARCGKQSFADFVFALWFVKQEMNIEIACLRS